MVEIDGERSECTLEGVEGEKVESVGMFGGTATDGEKSGCKVSVTDGDKSGCKVSGSTVMDGVGSGCILEESTALEGAGSCSRCFILCKCCNFFQMDRHKVFNCREQNRTHHRQ